MHPLRSRSAALLAPFFAAILCIASPASLPAADPSSIVATVPEEKRPLDHEDYDQWNRLRGQRLSRDGQWAGFTIQPADDDRDATLKIRHIDSGKTYAIDRGNSLRFTYDSQHALYTVAPDPDLIEKIKESKIDGVEPPKPALEILHLESGRRERIEDVARFTLPEEQADWVAFQRSRSEPKKLESAKPNQELEVAYEITPEGIRRPTKQKKFRNHERAEEAAGTESEKEATEEKNGKQAADGKKQRQEDPPVKKKEDHKPGAPLVLRHLPTQTEYHFPNVTSFRFDIAGSHLAYAISSPEGDRDGVRRFDLAKRVDTTLIDGIGHYGQVVFSEDGEQLTFLSDRDDYAAENPDWAVYHWKLGNDNAKAIVTVKDEAIRDGWTIAKDSTPSFAEDGKRLFFRTRPKPAEDDDADDDESEPVAKLDLWHWQDPQLQPQQLLQASRERNRTYQAIYNIAAGKALQIESPEIPDVSINRRKSLNIAIGVAPDKYRKQRSWDIQGFNDWYLMDLRSGKPKMLAEMKRGQPSLSPQGRYLTWWDGEAKTHFALPANRADAKRMKKPIDLGRGIPHPLQNELHDQPSLPGPYGSAGWTKNDAEVLIYDRWDIWSVDPRHPNQAICLTGDRGRKEKIRFRGVRLDQDATFVDLRQPQILSALVHETKASGYYRLAPAVQDDRSQPEPLIVLDEAVSGLRKADNDDRVLFTRSTFQRYPDLWASTLEFETTKRLSRANPQQVNYRWGTAELTRWRAEDGQMLDGILYKPEGFDPNKRYPLMVYFYERSSDRLHTYYPPAAGRSIINFSFYVSRGYCIFIPDIPYKTGEPGPSAANAILPGVDHLVDQGFIDEDRIGMQGHSWGGYQTAYLVTVSDRFACAESGAPVSNMTSAYGGIRWGSGMSRMFQYEKTQSRIGGTLWDSREKYIANSPVFFADKINTPLLILHNDEDTAVPWYQGIELFVALRRLEKPAWMLNYNGDPHWVMKDANRLDFAKRMQQFFDHYLLGDPMPVWMAEGIPATQKGEEFGFEYIPGTAIEESKAEEQ